jgi:hypothetical protein
VILADTSVWIDHFRRPDRRLDRYLDVGDILMHPFILGELALGFAPRHSRAFSLLSNLPLAVVATPDEVLAFIEAFRLAGAGIGYVDTHLLASARLTPRAVVLTHDRSLATVASRLGLGPA